VQSIVRLQEVAREHTAVAILKLRAIMDDPKARRVTQIAARELLDGAWGKPVHTLLAPDGLPRWQEPATTLEIARRVAFVLETARRELEHTESSTDVRTIVDDSVAISMPVKDGTVWGELDQ
jgi:hypothetical protein